MHLVIEKLKEWPLSFNEQIKENWSQYSLLHQAKISSVWVSISWYNENFVVVFNSLHALEE